MAALTIVCHNVFWLQGRPHDNANPGAPNPPILAGLALLYRALDPDVLCVQEIQSHDAFAALADALDMDGEYVAGAEHAQYGGAILHRRGMSADFSADPMPNVQRFRHVARLGHGDTTISIGNVHLPSGRQVGPERAAELRVAELRDMVNTLGAPDVVAGDLNERPGGLVGDLLTGLGYRDAAVLAGQANVSTNFGDGRGDYVWLHERVAERFVDYRVVPAEELATDAPGKNHQSDHLPVVVGLGG